jgi:chaperone modulatory protein CbpM
LLSIHAHPEEVDPMIDRPLVIGTLLEDACLTLEQVCGACDVSPEWVVVHVLEGRLNPPGDQPAHWRFASGDLRRVRQIRHLEIAFDAEPELAALVVDLMEELDKLRARLRQITPE